MNSPHVTRRRDPEPTPATMLLRIALLGLGLAAIFCLSSCSTAPTVRIAPGGVMTANLGMSLMEDSAWEGAEVTAPGGVVIRYAKEGKKQTTVPSTLTRWFFTDRMFGAAMTTGKVLGRAAINARLKGKLGAQATTRHAAEQETLRLAEPSTALP